jgi:hypothetical protein
MRRTLLVATVAVVVVVAVSLIAVAREPQLASPRRIVVVERANSDTVVDTDGSGTDTTGDLLTFHNPVFDRSNEDRIGRDQGECVRIDPAAGTWQCRWITTLFGRGSITVEGPFYDARDSVLAITGGTGKFSNVRGQMELHARSATVFEFAFALEP